MIKNRIVYLSVLAALIIAALFNGSAVLMGAAIVLAAIAAISGLSARRMAKKLEIQYKTEGVCTVDKQIPVFAYVKGRSFLPWGRIRARLSWKNMMIGSSWECSLDFPSNGMQEQIFSLDNLNRSCGKISVYVHDHQCMDSLGLFRIPMQIEERLEYLTYPPEVSVGLAILSRPRSDFSDSMFDQNRRGNDVTDIFGVRDYEAGDAIHSIHWKMTEKLDKLIVKEFSKPSRYHTIVLIDLHRNLPGREVENAEDIKKEEKTKAVKENKDSKGQSLSANTMNYVVATGMAISRVLLQNGIGHTVGAINAGVLEYDDVNGEDDCLNFQDKLLSMRIARSGDIMSDAFAAGIWQQYSKVIIVSGIVRNDDATGLMHATDVTLVVPSETLPDSHEKGDFEIITLALDSLKSGKCTIEI